MMASPQQTQASADAWFKAVSARLPAGNVPCPTGDDGAPVFEIALSLGGTVSAGAYTAGVLDFLVRALDHWSQVRQALNNAAPQGTPKAHHVRLKVVSGASGGGVCATALAKALAHDFHRNSRSGTLDPLDDPGFQAGLENNPFYRLWVKQLDLRGFDAPEAQPTHALTSLLNPQPLEDGSTALANYPNGQGVALQVPRDWVCEPLTTFLTLSNLSGVPYQVAFNAPANTQSYRKHADYVRFEFHYRDAHAQPHGWPDAWVVQASPHAQLPSSNVAEVLDWHRVSEFAVATGAFPLAFPAIQLERPKWHYLFHPFGQLDEHIKDWKSQPPAWTDGSPRYSFLSVDGGMLNNEPVTLARRHLADYGERNERKTERAHRAVVHVDPFSDQMPYEAPGQDAKNLINVIPHLAGTLLAHARFSTQDFRLAIDPSCASRFLVTAVRTTADANKLVGGRALASAALAAFSGFLDEAFRHHDFMLGRRNCQAFLESQFVLDSNNPLFGGDGTHPTNTNWSIVPLAGPRSMNPGCVPKNAIANRSLPEQDKPTWPGDRTNDVSGLSATLARVMKHRLGLAWQRADLPVPAWLRSPWGGITLFCVALVALVSTLMHLFPGLTVTGGCVTRVFLVMLGFISFLVFTASTALVLMRWWVSCQVEARAGKIAQSLHDIMRK